MEKKFTKKQKLTISLTAVVLIVAIIGVAILCFKLFKPKPDSKLNLDYRLGAVATKKVENAQYTPDMDKYLQANSAQAKVQSLSSRSGEVSSQATKEEFSSLIDEYAKVENYAGAGKYLGYDIYEIKNEIKFVVENVPAFNQWFRMPKMREEEGFLAIPYYESWAYYLEMDEETSALSITRVCWATRSDYLDFENQKTIEDYEDGTSFIQYEIMKTNYLETETEEIVECFIYSVGIDHCDRSYYNENPSDYHPFEFQYLRNVKDKSMVKYHLTVANRYRSDETFDEGGMDIRGLNPYGVRREFTIVNYDGYTDIDITKIDQKFATLDEPQNNGDVNFDVNSNNINILLNTIKYNQDISELTPKEALDKISKHIIDNFEIKNNWATIYKDQASAIDADPIYGPFYQKDMWLSDVSTYVSCRDWDKREIEFDANAQIYDMSKFDLDKEYSLSMALKSRETGKLDVVATSYGKLVKVQYNGGDENDYYYELFGTGLYLDSSVIAVEEDGTYDVVCVLTTKQDGKDVVLFDTLEIAFMRGYYGLIIPDSVDSKGVTHHYSAKGIGGKLTITVTSQNV